MDTRDPLILHTGDLARHTYILGATGCGKTSLILRLIEQDLKRGHTVAVVDLRGDLVRGVLGLCDRLEIDPERVTLLDLREKQRVQGFNPLSGAGEPYVRALHVLDVVQLEAESWGVHVLPNLI
ncbi:MAG TPA: helicase HerA-like domain-containing protein [Fimbriimonadaceae bacterium]|nr:helicase HerA-like domain-containing protein [Fimbriimonadaceae bacterium]